MHYKGFEPVIVTLKINDFIRNGKQARKTEQSWGQSNTVHSNRILKTHIQGMESRMRDIVR